MFITTHHTTKLAPQHVFLSPSDRPRQEDENKQIKQYFSFKQDRPSLFL